MVQYANEEYRQAKRRQADSAGITAEAAFARAKQNRSDAYDELRRVQARSLELRETDLHLRAAEQAERQNTTTANAIKAILKREQQASLYPQLRHWVNGALNGAIDELWVPDNPLDLRNTTWSALVERQAIFEALIKNGEEPSTKRQAPRLSTALSLSISVPLSSTSTLSKSSKESSTLILSPKTYNCKQSSRPCPILIQKTQSPQIAS
jgi:hypothetical protein